MFLNAFQKYHSMVLYFPNVFIRKAVDIFPERVFVCVVVSWSKYVKKCLIFKAEMCIIVLEDNNNIGVALVIK